MKLRCVYFPSGYREIARRSNLKRSIDRIDVRPIPIMRSGPIEGVPSVTMRPRTFYRYLPRRRVNGQALDGADLQPRAYRPSTWNDRAVQARHLTGLACE